MRLVKLGKKLDNANVVAADCLDKRRVTSTILCTARATVEKKLGHFKVPAVAREVKRSVTVPVLFIDCSAMVEEKLSSPDAAVSATVMKRSVTVAVFFIGRTATVEKKLRNFKLVPAAGHSKAAVRLKALYTGIAGIQVQRTPTQVAGSCRGVISFPAERTALLAQGRRSERGRRRRQLDDPSSFQPADVVVGCQLLPVNLQAHRLNVQLGERILQRCIESGQSPALGIYLHRHLLFAPQCCELHCCAIYVSVRRVGECWKPYPKVCLVTRVVVGEKVTVAGLEPATA